MTSSSDTKKITLIDDHILIRNGLRELIEKFGPYQVTAEFDNGRHLLDNLSTIDADLMIMDISMPEMDGVDTMEALNKLNCVIPVLILTLNLDDEKMTRLFRLGARGYLPKNCSAQVMREALQEVFRSGYYHNEFMARSLRQENLSSTSESDVILRQLSDREREFLKLVCHSAEYTYDQIAGIMNVQHRTVDGYRESIFQKFGIKSKTGLVLFVLRMKLFEKL